MKILKNLALLAVGITIISCESHTYEEISGEVPTTPTYEANVKQIISSNCLSCHSVETDGQTPLLETYQQVKDAIANDGLLEQIAAPSGYGMPEAGRLPQSQIDIITNWAATGFIEE